MEASSHEMDSIVENQQLDEESQQREPVNE